jgi:hypothetical protein
MPNDIAQWHGVLAPSGLQALTIAALVPRFEYGVAMSNAAEIRLKTETNKSSKTIGHPSI